MMLVQQSNRALTIVKVNTIFHTQNVEPGTLHAFNCVAQGSRDTLT
jgi:hypothetical protein